MEPAIFLFSIYAGIDYSIIQPFLFWRLCLTHFRQSVSLSPSSLSPAPPLTSAASKEWRVYEFCHQLSGGNETGGYGEVVALVDDFNIYLTLAQCLPALLCSPLLGAWSDGAGGRKRVLLLACGGVVVKKLIYLLVIIGSDHISVNWLFVANLLSAISQANSALLGQLSTSLKATQ